MGEKLGDNIDAVMGKAKKVVKEGVKKAKVDAKKMEDRLQKNVNKKFSRKNISDKNLSDLESAVANIAINIVHSVEETFKKLSEKIFCKDKDLNTKYGKIGAVYGKYKVLQIEAENCLKYAEEVDKKIPGNVKVKKGILKDVVEAISHNNDKLFGYYLYGYLLKKRLPTNVEEKKKVMKKYLFTKEERDYYSSEEKKEKKRGNKNEKGEIDEKKVRKSGKRSR